MTSFVKTPLFGGSLVCDLPEKFVDVRTMRQVPNNQEVFVDRDGFTSIIFDITERVGRPGSSPENDARALTVHLEDLLGKEDESEMVRVWNSTSTVFSRLDKNIPAYTLIATQSPRPGGKEQPGVADFTALILTLLRLEKQSTDILITVNVPHIKGEYDEDKVDLELGQQGELIGDAVEFAARIWETFSIKDWSIFDSA